MYHMRINGDMLDKDLLVAAAGLCQRFAQRGLAGPLLVASHHGRPHGAGDAPRSRRQSHHVPPLGVHHG